MNTPSDKPKRGRPQTLDRGKVLDGAMTCYWERGIGTVSLNEICRVTETSKPAIYREFGGEDGLMAAALAHYYAQVLAGVAEIFASGLLFEGIVDLWISVSLDKDANAHKPAGCLLVAMANAPDQLGPKTKEVLGDVERKVLAIYEAWFDRQMSEQSSSSSISPDRAARYLHAQFSLAMARMAAGEPEDVTKDILRLALSPFESLNTQCS